MDSILYRPCTFKASKLLLISAPSNLVCRSEFDVSAPRSFPKIRHTSDKIWLLFSCFYCVCKNELQCNEDELLAPGSSSTGC